MIVYGYGFDAAWFMPVVDANMHIAAEDDKQGFLAAGLINLSGDVCHGVVFYDACTLNPWPNLVFMV